MHHPHLLPFLLSALTAAVACISGCTSTDPARIDLATTSRNESLVQSSFDRWQRGTGGPFELLAEDVKWTITGSSPVSKSYQSKEHFMSEVIRPFNARMDRPLVPSIRDIYSEGDTVIVLFDAESRCIDGQAYRNTYAWFMEMEDGRAVRVTAFFDTNAFDEMWARVTPP